MNLLPSIILSASGVIVAALAFYYRNDRSWQRAMTWIMAVAIGQVVLGALSAVLLR
jgi:multisubunit Na+/H+ antiporter MnhB subunit